MFSVRGYFNNLGMQHAVGLFLALGACSSAQQGGSAAKKDASAVPARGATPGMPLPSANSGEERAAAAGPLAADGSSMIKASYRGKAQALGIDVCSGNLDVSVNLAGLQSGSVELFQIPNGVVTCSVVGVIDLKGILGSFGQKAASGSQAVADSLNHVISVSSLGGSTFVPPRPMLPALFTANAAELARLDVKTVVDMTTKDGKVVRGMTEIKMLSYDQPYTVVGGDQEFPHVVNFVILNTGFDGADKASNLLFDSMEFRISTDPIAILSVTFKGSLQSVLIAADSAQNTAVANSNGTAGGSPSFVTSVLNALPVVSAQMTLDLVEQTGLAEALAAAAKKISNGDAIGGKSVGH